MISLSPFTSVIRWLLVVVGCAVLATAQPMSAEEATPTPTGARTADTILYPRGNAATADESLSVERSQNWVLICAVLLALGGVWVLVQKRRGALPMKSADKRLVVEETRSLGNRQFLVVADYEGQKFLLGVTPGQIQMLAPLLPKDGAHDES